MSDKKLSADPPPITNFERSRALAERAHQLIPGGAHTYSKGDDQFPELAPRFLVKGKGCRVWDCDGNEYIDWGMGLRSVVLGYGYEPVLAAARAHLEDGSNFVRPHPIEVELAEVLVELIPCAQMVKFAKNGSDVTTAAVKLARAFTGRDLVVRCQEHPFFSVDDWFIGDTPCSAGVPQAIRDLTKRFSFNNPASLRQVFDQYPNQVAAVITEAAATEEPQPGFLQAVHQLCQEKGAVLILDEIITGFRWHLGGAQAYYGVTPDLATFGKAIGNGFSVSALVGRRDIMERGGIRHPHERVFLLSTTHGGETHALAAAKATIRALEQNDLVAHVWRAGRQLQDGINAIAAELGLAAFIECRGVPCSPYIVIKDREGQVSLPLRTLFLQETIRRGVLIPFIAPSAAHSPEEVSLSLDAMRPALKVVSSAIERGTTEGLLVGGPVKPVFRRFN